MEIVFQHGYYAEGWSGCLDWSSHTIHSLHKRSSFCVAGDSFTLCNAARFREGSALRIRWTQDDGWNLMLSVFCWLSLGQSLHLVPGSNYSAETTQSQWGVINLRYLCRSTGAGIKPTELLSSVARYLFPGVQPQLWRGSVSRAADLRSCPPDPKHKSFHVLRPKCACPYCGLAGRLSVGCVEGLSHAKPEPTDWQQGCRSVRTQKLRPRHVRVCGNSAGHRDLLWNFRWLALGVWGGRLV